MDFLGFGSLNDENNGNCDDDVQISQSIQCIFSAHFYVCFEN